MKNSTKRQLQRFNYQSINNITNKMVKILNENKNKLKTIEVEGDK